MPLIPAANLLLLLLYPVAWAAPLARTGLLPWWDGEAVSVLSGVAVLWEADMWLAGLVALFGIALPYAKTLALAGVHFGRLEPRRWAGALALLGKLSMADVFLIAVTIVVAKGVGVGRVETAWGLYLFAFCILASLGLSLLTERATRGERG